MVSPAACSPDLYQSNVGVQNLNYFPCDSLLIFYAVNGLKMLLKIQTLN